MTHLAFCKYKFVSWRNNIYREKLLLFWEFTNITSTIFLFFT